MYFGHEHLVLMGFTDFQELIRHPPHLPGEEANVSAIWATADLMPYSSVQHAIRPPAGEFEGTSTAGNIEMPMVGAWLAGGSEPNLYLLRREGVNFDRTLLAWFLNAGITSGAKVVCDFEEMLRDLQSSGRRLYGCDSYGDPFEGISLNCTRDFSLVNSKGWVRDLVGSFAPHEVVWDDMHRSIPVSVYEEVKGDANCIYLKTDNAEHGGMGVRKCESEQQFRENLEIVRRLQQKYGLKKIAILQRGARGKSMSFSFVIVPGQKEVRLMGVTEQLACQRTGRDLGNRVLPLSEELVQPLCPMIMELAENIRRHAPDAFGWVMCDYLDDGNGTLVAIDPGLRISASTPAILMQSWIMESYGSSVFVDSLHRSVTGINGFSFAGLAELLGPLCDPTLIRETGTGVIPFSWQQNTGWGRLMIAATDKQGLIDVEKTLRSKLPGKLADENPV